MSAPNLQELEQSAMRLDLAERAALVEKLLQSLDNLSEEENLRLWLAEAKQRHAEISQNESVLRDGGQVLRRLEAELK